MVTSYDQKYTKNKHKYTKNEEKQLRLGLGQVLRYMSLVNKQNISKIVPVLVAEKVFDVSWYKTCESQNVKLVASDNFQDLL